MSKTITIATSEDLVHMNDRITTLSKQVHNLTQAVSDLRRTKMNAPKGLQSPQVSTPKVQECYPTPRELQRQMFGLFSVCFGTSCPAARHTFTRNVLGWDEAYGPNPSWCLDNASFNESDRRRVLNALQAICEVEDLVGRRVAR